MAAQAKEIPPRQPDALVVAQPTPMAMLQSAIQQGANMDTIERLVLLQERMLAHDAEVAYNEAMNRAQAQIGRVAADLVNPQTRSKYASYAAIDRVIRPAYSKEGMALSFDTEASPLPEHVRVLCYVSHAAGHTKTYRVDMPADGKGAKGGDVMTKTHAAGAAMAYGMRYLVKMIFNIAVGEDDNDGNLTNGGLAKWLDELDHCVTVEGLKTAYQSAFKELSEQKAYKALGLLTEKRDARRKAIAEAEGGAR